MRRFLQIMLLAALGVLPAVSAVAESDGVKAFKIGDVEVWAIADSISERDLSVFPAVTPEMAKEYVPHGKTPSAIMVFLIKMGDQLILVDTGLGGPASYMLSGLTQTGFTPDDVTAVLVTHYHGDHIGGLLNGDDKVFPNAKIYSSQKEQVYWLDYDTMLANPSRRGNFELARKVFDVYAEDNKVFDFNKTVLPGIKALDAGGHTPGQTVFLLESGDARLLLWADLTHAAALQFPRPDINARYDMNPEMAAAARLRYMEMAVADNLIIAGAHLPFPGVGRVVKTADGVFSYVPLSD